MGYLTHTVSGNPVSFQSADVMDMDSLKVHFAPVQEGTGDPSPTNVRPITGWTGLNTWTVGKNKAKIIAYGTRNTNSKDAEQSLSNDYGTSINTTEYNLPDTPLVITQSVYPDAAHPINFENGYFTIVVDNLVYDHYYDISFKITDILSNPLDVNIGNISIMSPAGWQNMPIVSNNYLIYKNVKWERHHTQKNRSNFEIRICGMSFTLSEFMVTDVGVEDRTYETYGVKTTVDWTSTAGTLYGGYIDLANGSLTQTWIFINGSDFTSYNNNNGFVAYRKNNVPVAKSINSGISNIISAFDMFYSSSMYQNIIQLPDNSNNIYLALNENISINDLQIAYELSEPIVYQLDPSVFKTIKGQNTIWSNTNDQIDATYKFIDHLSKKRLKITQPHIEAPTPSSLITFNSNVELPVKDCKIHFEPVQEGMGDPSPDNIRPITGWTGINAYHFQGNLIRSPSPYIDDNLGVKWIVLEDGTIEYEGTPTSWSSVFVGSYDVVGNEKIEITIIGDISNVVFNNCPVFDENTTRVANLLEGKRSYIVDFSRYPTAKIMNIYLKRNNNNVYMSGRCFVAIRKYGDDLTTIPIDWSSSAGTVYGGHVDLASNTLVATHKLKHIVASNVIGVSTGTNAPYRPYTDIISDAKIYLGLLDLANNMLCDKLTTQSVPRLDPILWEAYINKTGRLVWGAPSELSTVEAAKNWITEIGGLDLIYELATPIVYQTDSVDLHFLRGYNNLWSNANGNIELKYWKY